MSAYFLLFIECLTSFVASFAVLYVLMPSLRQILGRICPDEPAAAFWISYTKIMLLVAPLLLVLMMDMVTRYSDPVDAWRLALITSLVGILFGLHSIGKRLAKFEIIPKKSGEAS